jgi:hypothetical protein
MAAVHIVLGVLLITLHSECVLCLIAFKLGLIY